MPFYACDLSLFLPVPGQLPSFSSSSCPSSQSFLPRGHWRHKAGHPAPPNLPAGRGTSRQPDDMTDFLECRRSSPQSGGN